MVWNTPASSCHRSDHVLVRISHCITVPAAVSCAPIGRGTAWLGLAASSASRSHGAGSRRGNGSGAGDGAGRRHWTLSRRPVGGAAVVNLSGSKEISFTFMEPSKNRWWSGAHLRLRAVDGTVVVDGRGQVVLGFRALAGAAAVVLAVPLGRRVLRSIGRQILRPFQKKTSSINGSFIFWNGHIFLRVKRVFFIILKMTTQSDPVKLGKTQSNPVKPSQTH